MLHEENHSAPRQNSFLNHINEIKYVAAPMVDLSHLAFRLLCRKYNAHLCYTPMLHSKQFVNDPFYREENFITCTEDRPLIVQFCANKPEMFLAAAELVQDQCDAVDLNLGCPQVIAKRGYYGAYLQEDWTLIEEIIKLASSQLKIPVTCKIRILSGDISRTVAYARMLEKAGCKLLAVHGRTREQKGDLAGLADWKAICAIKEAVRIPVVANGNILNFTDIRKCMDFTGCNAVMSAETLLHNPALFANKSIPVWQMAEEYLELCKQYPVHPKIIRTILFRMCSLCFLMYRDLQQNLGEARELNDFQVVCAQLKSKVFCHITRNNLQKKLNEKPSSPEETSKEKYTGEGSHINTTNDICNDLSSISLQKDINSVNGCSGYGMTQFWICQSLPPDVYANCKTSLKAILQKDEVTRGSLNNVLNQTPSGNLSKNQMRKIIHHQRVIEMKKTKRKMQKEKRQQKLAKLKQDCIITKEQSTDSVYLSKRQNKELLREKLSLAQLSGPCVCIDLGFSHLMSAKELQKLSGQLRRLYGSNRAAEKPFRVIFTNFKKTDPLYAICKEKNDGFENYMIEMTEKSHIEVFEQNDLIYLTPDSPSPLTTIEPNKVFVIGGLVDETVNKFCTLNEANAVGVETARLPISEHLQKQEKGSFSQVLTVNQIFDILLKYSSCGNWTDALLAGIPQRKGFASPSNTFSPS